ncbi:MAG: MoaD/ThiS family protein [Dehalococcoidia bacterium]|nr:MoaD/ThiS family protein [Dehalococcoidia bacterium]
MVKVKAKYYGVIKDLIKAPTAEFELPDDATMSDLLALMEQRYGQEFALRVLDDRIGVRSYVKLFLNDEEVDSSAIGTTRLGKAGPDAEATLFIMPSSTGG